MGYALTAVIILAIAFTAAGAMHVRAELGSVPRPSRVVVRWVVRRLPRVMPASRSPAADWPAAPCFGAAVSGSRTKLA